jgi:hypothetical protein
MTALEQAAEFQQRAIDILLTEREQIDARLQQLGYGDNKTAPMKKRGRPLKDVTSISARPDTTEPVFPSPL